MKRKRKQQRIVTPFLKKDRQESIESVYLLLYQINLLEQELIEIKQKLNEIVYTHASNKYLTSHSLDLLSQLLHRDNNMKIPVCIEFEDVLNKVENALQKKIVESAHSSLLKKTLDEL